MCFMNVYFTVFFRHSHKHKPLFRKPFTMIHIYCFSFQSSIITMMAVDRLRWPISAQPFCACESRSCQHKFSAFFNYKNISQMALTKTGKIWEMNLCISLAKVIFTWIFSMFGNYGASMLLWIKLYTWPFFFFM